MMDERDSSWIRRARFSHTVCHRLDASSLLSLPAVLLSERGLVLKPKNSSSVAVVQPCGRAQLNLSPSKKVTLSPCKKVTYSDSRKQRSISPLPETVISEAFKEARSERKRFSTPRPRQKEASRGIFGKLFHRDTQISRSPVALSPTPSSTLQNFWTSTISERSKARKECSWTKYFESGGGKVSAIDATDDWTVDLSKLFLGLKFASGAHSRLYRGIYNDQPVAVKMITVPDDDENGVMATRLEKQFVREVTLLSRLCHQHVIKLVAACKKAPVFCIITEYLDGGSLRAYLRKLKPKSLSLQKIIAFALDIARGLEYIHAQGVIHRDVKPENILLGGDFSLKVADFGIACEEAYCDSLADDPGTYRWMAPEMIKHKPYSRKVDIYSFGLLLWELVAGAIPYEDMTPIQAAFAVVNKNLRPRIPDDCPAALCALIEQCWTLYPEKRPEFWQIVKVLEQFESSLSSYGQVDLLPNSRCSDHRKQLVHWIHSLRPCHGGPLIHRLV